MTRVSYKCLLIMLIIEHLLLRYCVLNLTTAVKFSLLFNILSQLEKIFFISQKNYMWAKRCTCKKIILYFLSIKLRDEHD